MFARKLVSAIILVVFVVTMAAPAWASGCRCPMMQKMQQQLPPCHKAKADTQTPQKKSCCDKSCSCEAVPAPGALLLPQPGLTPLTFSVVDYTLASAHFFAARILAPPVSPPNA